MFLWCWYHSLSAAATAESGGQFLQRPFQLGWSESKWCCCPLEEVYPRASWPAAHCRIPQHLQRRQRSVGFNQQILLGLLHICNSYYVPFKIVNSTRKSKHLFYLIVSHMLLYNIMICNISSFTYPHNNLMATFPDFWSGFLSSLASPLLWWRSFVVLIFSVSA